jgi:hypothetical protein
MLIRKELLSEIDIIISNAREKAIRSVDFERVLMYWYIGQKIFEEEQGGRDRAGYGEALIQSLALTLEPLYGSSFSYRQLNLFRQFYRTFPIMNALRSQFSWTHYRLLMRIDGKKNWIFIQQKR